jgi:hypothetical protein
MKQVQMAAALYCQRLKLVQSSYVSHPATNNNASQAYILGYMPNRFIKGKWPSSCHYIPDFSSDILYPAIHFYTSDIHMYIYIITYHYTHNIHLYRQSKPYEEQIQQPCIWMHCILRWDFSPLSLTDSAFGLDTPLVQKWSNQPLHLCCPALSAQRSNSVNVTTAKILSCLHLTFWFRFDCLVIPQNIIEKYFLPLAQNRQTFP